VILLLLLLMMMTTMMLYCQMVNVNWMFFFSKIIELADTVRWFLDCCK